MTDPVAARPPANVPIPHARDHSVSAEDAAIDTRDVSFREIWNDPDKGMTFGDLLDVINPLQHIPVVSTIYRLVTGDTLSQGARLAGGILFGGVSGLLSSGVVAAFEEASGRSVEGHIASLFEDGEPAPPRRQIAAAGTAAPAAATAPPAPQPPAPPGAAGTPEPDAGAREARAEKLAAERRRIAETIDRARSQQTALLLANLEPAAGRTEDAEDGRDGAAPRRPRPPAAPPAGAFRAHPFMLPPGASPEMVSRAMERALSKYHQGLRTGRTAP